jgi:hypothetical protein
MPSLLPHGRFYPGVVRRVKQTQVRRIVGFRFAQPNAFDAAKLSAYDNPPHVADLVAAEVFEATLPFTRAARTGKAGREEIASASCSRSCGRSSDR